MAGGGKREKSITKYWPYLILAKHYMELSAMESACLSCLWSLTTFNSEWSWISQPVDGTIRNWSAHDHSQTLASVISPTKGAFFLKLSPSIICKHSSGVLRHNKATHPPSGAVWHEAVGESLVLPNPTWLWTLIQLRPCGRCLHEPTSHLSLVISKSHSVAQLSAPHGPSQLERSHSQQLPTIIIRT
jgi:hypothetical protein